MGKSALTYNYFYVNYYKGEESIMMNKVNSESSINMIRAYEQQQHQQHQQQQQQQHQQPNITMALGA
eukprot:Pgem_evm1s8232